MATTEDVMIYLAEQYPYKDELSNARLTKMVYLADWASSIREGEQITKIKWIFHNYGPYVDDIISTAKSSSNFEVVPTENRYGNEKVLIKLTGKPPYPSLSSDDKKNLDFVIEKCKRLSFNDFIKLVYSTYPILTQPRGTELDLPVLARRYAELGAQEPATAKH